MSVRRVQIEYQVQSESVHQAQSGELLAGRPITIQLGKPAAKRVKDITSRELPGATVFERRLSPGNISEVFIQGWSGPTRRILSGEDRKEAEKEAQKWQRGLRSISHR
jgi:hypothetical protein